MTQSSATPTANGVIAITGATGFIGLHLLSQLDAQGLATRALIRARRNRKLQIPKTTQIISGSLGNAAAVAALLKDVQTCIHVAGVTASINVSGFHETNVIGSYDVAAAAYAAGVQHFIHVSSQAARAPWISDYAASKALSEVAIQTFAPHMKVTIIRPPAVIGPGDPMLRPMFKLIKSGWLPAPAEPKGKTRKFAVISVGDLVAQIVSQVRMSDTTPRLVEPCSLPATDWAHIAAAVSDVLRHDVRTLRLSPSLMQCIGASADAIAHLIRRPLPLSGNKVRELLAVDWTYDHPVRDAMDLREIFVACFEDQNSEL